MLGLIPERIRRAVALAIWPEGRPDCPLPSPHEDSPEDPVPPPVLSGIDVIGLIEVEMARRVGRGRGRLADAVYRGFNPMKGSDE